MQGSPLRLHDNVETAVIGESTIVTAGGQVHLALTDAEAELVGALDGTLGLHELVDRFGDGAEELVNDLADAGLLVGTQPPAEPQIALTSAGVEFAGFDRFVAQLDSLVGRIVGNRRLRPLLLVLTVLGLVGVLVPPQLDGDRFSATATLTVLLTLTMASSLVHETAHALVIHRNGRRVGRAGFGFYWGEISFFVDATDAYFLPKRLRVAQTLVGPATDAVVAAALSVASHLVGSGSWAVLLHQAAITAWLVALVNAAPVLKLDGHWALADLLDCADLNRDMLDALRRFRTGRRDRRTLLLASYGVATGCSAIVLLATSAAAWTTHYGPLVVEAWSSGAGGMVVAMAFAAPMGVAIIAGAVQRLARRLTG